MSYRISYGGASTHLLEAYLRGLTDGWFVELALIGGGTVAGYTDGWDGGELVVAVADLDTMERTGSLQHVRVHEIESLVVP